MKSKGNLVKMYRDILRKYNVVADRHGVPVPVNTILQDMSDYDEEERDELEYASIIEDICSMLGIECDWEEDGEDWMSDEMMDEVDNTF